jgi:predicted CopG family antitoxin
MMVSKNIAVKKQVYDKLLSLKGEKESFSDLLERLINISINNRLGLGLNLLKHFEGTSDLPEEFADIVASTRENLQGNEERLKKITENIING